MHHRHSAPPMSWRTSDGGCNDVRCTYLRPRRVRCAYESAAIYFRSIRLHRPWSPIENVADRRNFQLKLFGGHLEAEQFRGRIVAARRAPITKKKWLAMKKIIWMLRFWGMITPTKLKNFFLLKYIIIFSNFQKKL